MAYGSCDFDVGCDAIPLFNDTYLLWFCNINYLQLFCTDRYLQILYNVTYLQFFVLILTYTLFVMIFIYFYVMSTYLLTIWPTCIDYYLKAIASHNWIFVEILEKKVFLVDCLLDALCLFFAMTTKPVMKCEIEILKPGHADDHDLNITFAWRLDLYPNITPALSSIKINSISINYFGFFFFLCRGCMYWRDLERELNKSSFHFHENSFFWRKWIS